MLDEYFAEQMKEIIRSCSRTRQTMLFSATMSEQVKDLAAVSLDKPVKVFVNTNQTVAFNLRQEFIRIRSRKPEANENGDNAAAADDENGDDAHADDSRPFKKGNNQQRAKRGGRRGQGQQFRKRNPDLEQKERDDREREPILAALVCRTFHDHCMIFVQRKRQAHRLHILLGLLGIKAGELHGNLTQQQRLESLKQFKDEQIDILIATDVAARGLDIVGVKTVINFNMPLTTEHYIHRVGRTARAGRAGISVSLADERERKQVKDIIKSADNPVKNRIIPPEIIEKYTKKLNALQPEISESLPSMYIDKHGQSNFSYFYSFTEKILDEEREERMFAKMEQQVAKAEIHLKGMSDKDRSWFQTMKQRRDERERLTNNFKAAAAKANEPDDPAAKAAKLKEDRLKKLSESKRKKVTDADKKKTPSQLAKERYRQSMEKGSLLRAKALKSAKRPQKLRSVHDQDDAPKQSVKKPRTSKFANDLTDTSRRGAKRLR